MVEVEDLTESRVQTHIGKIYIHTKVQQSIDEVIEFVVEGELFFVKFLEDLAEIIDFGPCYNVDEGNSHSSSDQEEDKPIEGDALSDDENFVKDSPLKSHGNWRTAVKRQSTPSLRGLDIVAELNDLLDSHSAKDDNSHTTKILDTGTDKGCRLDSVAPLSESVLVGILILKVIQTGLTLGVMMVDQIKTLNGPLVVDKYNLWKGSNTIKRREGDKKGEG